MKGSGEGATYFIMNREGTPSQRGQPNLTTGSIKKHQDKGKDNLWCNYYKRKGHIKENCWKLHGLPLQVHMVNSPYLSQRGQLENTMDGQRWAPAHIPQNHSTKWKN